MSGQRILGVFFRYFYVALKGIHQLSDLFYWPLVDILIWGLTSLWIVKESHVSNLSLILMTALVLWQVVWRGSVDISVSLLQEFWHRNLVNLFSTPLKISEWVAGMLLLSFCKLVITILFGAGVVYFFYSLNIFTLGWVFIPFAGSLVIFGWALSFISSSLIIYWGHKVEMFAWMMAWVFAPFSAVFYPITTLPVWAQKIAWGLPTPYIFESMRSILMTGTFPLSYFWMSLGLSLAYFAAAALFFRFMFEKTRAKGLARLE